ncbi:hypothetical protein [Clostridium homopropionicum]|uniref:hypothetical protein n=1 Tax=Clostridium homopropionicum TaxID=36844 RepID=UPI00068A7854|nr:hypothetical protein [Clostridium homopropionicum]
MEIVGIDLIDISSNLPFLVNMNVIFVGGISVAVPTLISPIGNLAEESRGVAVSLYAILCIGFFIFSCKNERKITPVNVSDKNL